MRQPKACPQTKWPLAECVADNNASPGWCCHTSDLVACAYQAGPPHSPPLVDGSGYAMQDLCGQHENGEALAGFVDEFGEPGAVCDHASHLAVAQMYQDMSGDMVWPPPTDIIRPLWAHMYSGTCRTRRS